MRVGTVVSAAALAPARVLAGGLAEHHPGVRLTALALTPTGPDEPFEVVRLPDLGLADLERPTTHNWPAFAALLRPAFVRWLLDRDEEPVVFLDPAVDVVAPMAAQEGALDAHPLVLVRRLPGLLAEDDLRPREVEYAKAGL